MRHAARRPRWLRSRLADLLAATAFGFTTIAVAAPAAASTSPPAAPVSDPITIGVFVPSGIRDGGVGKDVLDGARFAVERANRQGGVRGRPLRLVTAAADHLWEGATGDLVRLIYEERAVAIIGGLDARAAHLAEQVITRARGETLFLTPWASEPTLTQIRIPWFFRLVPDDRQQAGRLAREIFEARRIRRVAVWVADTPDTVSAALAFRHAAPEGAVTEFQAGREGVRETLDRRITRGEFGALLLLDAPAASAGLAMWLQGRGHVIQLFGPLTLARRDFFAAAGPAVEGAVVITPDPGAPTDFDRKVFQREFEELHGRTPEAPALYAHDAVAVLVEALRRSGTLGGDRLAAALGATTLRGLTGEVRFDRRLGREGSPSLAVVRRGELVPIGRVVRTSRLQER